MNRRGRLRPLLALESASAGDAAKALRQPSEAEVGTAVPAGRQPVTGGTDHILGEETTALKERSVFNTCSPKGSDLATLLPSQYLLNLTHI